MEPLSTKTLVFIDLSVVEGALSATSGAEKPPLLMFTFIEIEPSGVTFGVTVRFILADIGSRVLTGTPSTTLVTLKF